MFAKISESLTQIAAKMRHKDDEKALKRALDELKKALLGADVHFKVLKELLADIESLTKSDSRGIGKDSFLNALKVSLEKILQSGGKGGFNFAPKPPTIVLFAGLQGSGKTTSIVKLANYLKTRQKRVLLAACDLQRLAAVEQLKQLAAQAEIDLFFEENKTAVQIAKNAAQKAKSGLYDVLLVDSAGRLAIDEPLMQELGEIKDAINPHEIFYVVDSMSGQDGVRAASTFHQKINLSGVILSKFDGDSKGGIALSIAHQLGLPLKFIGVGEKIADFEIFLPERIVGRLLGAGDIAGLAERTAAVISEQEAKNLQKKIKKGKFTFEDFLAQVENVKKLGSVSSLMSMIPGLGNMAKELKDVDIENTQGVRQLRAMVASMTKKERNDPDLLANNPSRRRRIALGAGLDIADVNRALKQFDNAAKMMKRFGNKANMSDVSGLLNQMRNAQLGGRR